jgi:prevent-host-death family protein
MPVYNLREARADFSRLVRSAMRGEEVVLAKRDRPVARIVPYQTEHSSSGGPAGGDCQYPPADERLGFDDDDGL